MDDDPPSKKIEPITWVKVAFVFAGFAGGMLVAFRIDQHPHIAAWIIGGACGAVIARWFWEACDGILGKTPGIVQDLTAGVVALFVGAGITYAFHLYGLTSMTSLMIYTIMLYYVIRKMIE